MKNKCILRLLLLGFASLIITHPVLLAVEKPKSDTEQAEPEKGPNGGKIFRENDFSLELLVYEIGVPPEFRVWVKNNDNPIPSKDVSINIKLTRLGDIVDDINFYSEGEFFRSDKVVYEPHSFVVTINAKHNTRNYRWEYDNFEGRTQISGKIAREMGIKTEAVGEATLHQTIPIYGKLKWPPGSKRKLKARFPGEIKKMHVKLGDKVTKGQVLATIESNESLKNYELKSPLNGIISLLSLNEGELAEDHPILEVTQTKTILAELAVFPMDWKKIKLKAPVSMTINGVDQTYKSQIEGIYSNARPDQAKVFWASLDNSKGLLSENLFVSAKVEIAKVKVPLAVKRIGLQAFRDFTVVYEKIDDQYEVRMLELGRKAGPWVEVLGGISSGSKYVTENSYIIKADIEKSGASHDH